MYKVLRGTNKSYYRVFITAIMRSNVSNHSNVALYTVFIMMKKLFVRLIKTIGVFSEYSRRLQGVRSTEIETASFGN